MHTARRTQSSGQTSQVCLNKAVTANYAAVNTRVVRHLLGSDKNAVALFPTFHCATEAQWSSAACPKQALVPKIVPQVLTYDLLSKMGKTARDQNSNLDPQGHYSALGWLHSTVFTQILKLLTHEAHRLHHTVKHLWTHASRVALQSSQLKEGLHNSLILLYMPQRSNTRM